MEKLKNVQKYNALKNFLIPNISSIFRSCQSCFIYIVLLFFPLFIILFQAYWPRKWNQPFLQVILIPLVGNDT